MVRGRRCRLARRLAGGGRAADQPSRQLPARQAAACCSVQLAGRDPAATGHVRPRYAIICRDAAVPVGQLYALRAGRDDPERRGSLRSDRRPRSARPAGRRSDRRPRPRRDGRMPPPRRSTSATESIAGGAAARSTSRKASPATTARCASACARSSPTGRCRARSRSRPPAPAIPPPSRACRRVRSTRPPPSPRPIAATTRAPMPKRRPSSRAERRRRGRRHAAPKPWSTRRSSSPTSAIMERPTLRFGEAADLVGADPVVARMLRNYRALDALNRELADAALAELARPLPPGTDIDSPAVRALTIDARTAARLNSERPPRASSAAAAAALLPEEKARFARRARRSKLRGTILRLQGHGGAAAAALGDAQARIDRGPRRPDRLDGLDARADPERAGRHRRERGATTPRPSACTATSIALLEGDYPGSPALLSAEGRLAGYYARKGRLDEARSLYREIVDAERGSPASPRRACAARSRPISSCWRAAGRAGGGRRAVPREPAARPARRRPDPGRAGARAERRQRRGRAPVPPVGQSRPRHRARPGRASPGSPRCRSPTRTTSRASPKLARTSHALEQRPGRDPGEARRISRATGSSRAARWRSPTCSRCFARARPITR